jgi:hypothetical protein
MGRVRHSWREACVAALEETDVRKLGGRIEYAITALERRYAEWGEDPGTPAELKAIQKTIVALERRLEEKIRSAINAASTTGTADTPPYHVSNDLGQVRRLLLVLRSSNLYGKGV